MEHYKTESNTQAEDELNVSTESTDNSTPESEFSYCSGDSSEEEHVEDHTKPKILITISPEELIDCTHAVATRYNIGVRPQTSLIAAICSKSGVNLDGVNGSRNTVHRKKFKKIECLGDQIRQEISDTLKGKRLCLHFDGKQVKQIEEDS